MLKRDLQPEWMDQPDLPADLHHDALAGLARLNRFTCVADAMYRHLRKHVSACANRPMRVLDVASGSGDVPIAWAKRARRDGIRLQITTIDISGTAIEEQEKLAEANGVSLTALEMDCLASPLPGGFDIVTCSLFMHHLDDHQTTKLLKSMQSATENAILICDLERSRLNLGLVATGAHLLSRSPVVHKDASISVRSAYTATEFKRLAEAALSRPVRVVRTFPCRFIATLDEKVVIESAVAFA